MSDVEYVQTVLVNLDGSLSITLIPKQDASIKRVKFSNNNYFLSSISNDGSDQTSKFGFYILVQTAQEFVVETTESTAEPVEVATEEAV